MTQRIIQVTPKITNGLDLERISFAYPLSELRLERDSAVNCVSRLCWSNVISLDCIPDSATDCFLFWFEGTPHLIFACRDHPLDDVNICVPGVHGNPNMPVELSIVTLEELITLQTLQYVHAA